MNPLTRHQSTVCIQHYQAVSRESQVAHAILVYRLQASNNVITAWFPPERHDQVININNVGFTNDMIDVELHGDPLPNLRTWRSFTPSTDYLPDRALNNYLTWYRRSDNCFHFIP